MTHRGGQRTYLDLLPPLRRNCDPVREPGEHRVYHLVQAQAGICVLFRRPPDLGVHHPIRGKILHAFAGDPVQPGGRLHHRDGVAERLEIANQRA